MTLPCPFCTSEHTVPRTFSDGSTSYHCQLCGEDFPSLEQYPGDPYDDEDYYDVCKEEGHDWQLVAIAGVDCFECVRCAAIDC